MLENLARLGYIRSVEGCSGACHGCAGGRCSVPGQGKIWSLTERGLRAAKEQGGAA
jgi:hypothetical protein